MSLCTQQLMAKLGRLVVSNIPAYFGFCLIIFPFSRPGIASYISNAERATMILALKEKIKVLEAKQDFENPNEN